MFVTFFTCLQTVHLQSGAQQNVTLFKGTVSGGGG
jgi:hypothetical protein